MMLSGRLMEYARQCVRDGVFGILQEAVLSEFAHEITVLEAIAGDKVILNEQCAALESRVEALEKDAQRYRWLRGDGRKPTAYCPEEEGIWGGEELDAFCDAALTAEPKLIDLGGGLSSYENLGRNPPEERAALAKEEKKP